jgi:hypothetical protein
MIHTVSSGLQSWVQVLDCCFVIMVWHLCLPPSPSLSFPFHCSVVVAWHGIYASCPLLSSPLLSPLLCHGDMAISTYEPPCEQWLTSVGADAGTLFSGGVVLYYLAGVHHP